MEAADRWAALATSVVVAAACPGLVSGTAASSAAHSTCMPAKTRTAHLTYILEMHILKLILSGFMAGGSRWYDYGGLDSLMAWNNNGTWLYGAARPIRCSWPHD